MTFCRFRPIWCGFGSATIFTSTSNENIKYKILKFKCSIKLWFVNGTTCFTFLTKNHCQSCWGCCVFFFNHRKLWRRFDNCRVSNEDCAHRDLLTKKKLAGFCSVKKKTNLKCLLIPFGFVVIVDWIKLYVYTVHNSNGYAAYAPLAQVFQSPYNQNGGLVVGSRFHSMLHNNKIKHICMFKRNNIVFFELFKWREITKSA